MAQYNIIHHQRRIFSGSSETCWVTRVHGVGEDEGETTRKAEIQEGPQGRVRDQGLGVE